MVMIVQPVKTAKTTELCTFKNFLFYIGVELIKMLHKIQVYIKVIHSIHVSIPFQILFPFRLLHNIEQSSLRNTAHFKRLSLIVYQKYYT